MAGRIEIVRYPHFPAGPAHISAGRLEVQCVGYVHGRRIAFVSEKHERFALVDGGARQEARPFSMTQAEQRSLCVESSRVQDPTLTIDGCWPRPYGLRSVALKARGHADSCSANAGSQFKRANLYLTMRPSENINERGTECHQASVAKLAARNLWQPKVQRPGPIEFTQHQPQCIRLFLDASDDWSGPLTAAPRARMVLVAIGCALAGVMREMSPPIAAVAKKDPTAAPWTWANVRTPRRGA
jgi:hypothetical protein